MYYSKSLFQISSKIADLVIYGYNTDKILIYLMQPGLTQIILEFQKIFKQSIKMIRVKYIAIDI